MVGSIVGRFLDWLVRWLSNDCLFDWLVVWLFWLVHWLFSWIGWIFFVWFDDWFDADGMGRILRRGQFGWEGAEGVVVVVTCW